MALTRKQSVSAFRVSPDNSEILGAWYSVAQSRS